MCRFRLEVYSGPPLHLLIRGNRGFQDSVHLVSYHCRNNVNALVTQPDVTPVSYWERGVAVSGVLLTLRQSLITGVRALFINFTYGLRDLSEIIHINLCEALKNKMKLSWII